MSKNCTRLKTPQVRTRFGSRAVEKVHAVVARSTFPSQKWFMLRALLDVEMLKKCAQLWHEAHSEVKMVKAPQCRSTFGSGALQKVHAAAVKMVQAPHVRTTFGS